MFPLLTFLVLWNVVYISGAYYLSRTALYFDEAEEFCIKQCGSNLASIHSDHDFQTILNLINNDTYTLHLNGDLEVLVGLYYYNNKFQWTDNSSFDYANDTSGNNGYPWNNGEPSFSQCVVVDIR